jgi:hypothetical protein
MPTRPLTVANQSRPSGDARRAASPDSAPDPARLGLKQQFGFERAAPGQRGSNRVAGNAAQTARHDQPEVGLRVLDHAGNDVIQQTIPFVPNQAAIVLSGIPGLRRRCRSKATARSLAQSENRLAAEAGASLAAVNCGMARRYGEALPLFVPIHSPPSRAGKSAVMGEPGSPSALVKVDTFPSLNRCKAPARVPAQTVPCASAQTARTQSSDRPLAVE